MRFCRISKPFAFLSTEYDFIGLEEVAPAFIPEGRLTSPGTAEEVSKFRRKIDRSRTEGLPCVSAGRRIPRRSRFSWTPLAAIWRLMQDIRMDAQTLTCRPSPTSRFWRRIGTLLLFGFNPARFLESLCENAPFQKGSESNTNDTRISNPHSASND